LINPPIATNEIQSINDLAKQIRFCSQIQFTGRLDLSLKDSPIHQWSLFFHRGDLAWAVSEFHPLRRWHRQLFQCCPQLITKAGSQDTNQLQYVDYLSLLKLMRQDRVLAMQVKGMVKNSILEILFDIVQTIQTGVLLHHRAQVKSTCRYVPFNVENLISSASIFIPVEHALQGVEQDWKLWKQAGLSEVSPNHAPVIWKAEELRHQISATAYRNLSTLVDGDRTFRDLAVKLKQPVLDVVQSIKPYVEQGLIKLIEAGDLHSSNKLTPEDIASRRNSSLPKSTKPQAATPLIAYVDDSQFDQLTMSDILVQHGYRFINIQDPIQALPLLLELKPSIVLLDLVMPYTNGYEVCAQIRRTTILKQTPVIIVTSSDGIIDRVRARIVGASGFLAKPISPDKVLAILQKYLPISLVSLERSTVQSN
jgi:CheY-like chemotaxis protein